MAGFLGSLFGSSAKPAPAPKVQTANDSIKNMKSTQDLLRKKQQVLEAKIQGETENAARLAKLMKTNPRKKSEALMHLNKQIINAQKQATQVLRQQQQEIGDVDTVEDML